MISKGLAAVLGVALSSSFCFGAPSAETDPVMTAYRDAVLTQLDKLEAAIPEMTRSADIAAERLVGGGDLYMAGERAFVNEASGRAGGLMMLNGYRDRSDLTAKDVIFVGAWTNQDEKGLAACKRAKEAGAYVVLFSPAFEDPKAPAAALCDAHVVTFAPAESLVVPVGKGKRTGPTERLFAVTALWSYTGELVASLTRKGKTPVMWESVALPGGEARNALYLGAHDPAKRRFHDGFSVPPQPEGMIARLYLDAMRREVSGLRGIVLEQLSETGRLMADCVRAGGKVEVQTESHFTTHEVVGPPAPPWLKADFEPQRKGEVPADQLAPTVKRGDLFFHLGYYELPEGYADALRKAGVTSVFTLCHASVAPLTVPQPDMLIDAQWVYGDACVLLPRYDVMILPSSGVLQTTIFWTAIAKAESLLAAD